MTSDSAAEVAMQKDDAWRLEDCSDQRGAGTATQTRTHREVPQEKAQYGAHLGVVNGPVVIRGDIAFGSVGEIDSWFASIGGQTLEVDLSGVTFFDASGLRTLLNLRRRRPNLRLVHVSAAVLRVLEITATRDHLLGEDRAALPQSDIVDVLDV